MQVDRYSPVWHVDFAVHSSDIGYHGTMRISNLCSYFQEVAGQHAQHLDVGYGRMRESGMAWVLSRLTVGIRRLPVWGETIWMETWPLGIERIFYHREFRVGMGDEILAEATSYWIPLDLKTRRPRPVPIPEGVLKANEGRYGAGWAPEIVPSAGQCETAGTVTVKYSDLDQNKHVNNARYVEWVFDCLGPDSPFDRMPFSFSIEYRHEVRKGDVVHMKRKKSEKEKDTYLVEGIHTATEQPAFRAKVKYMDNSRLMNNPIP